jgi:hypothetical protein
MALPNFLLPLQPLPGAGPPMAGAAAPGAGSLAGFVMQVQQKTNWCWAAVSASVAGFFGGAWTQCAIASAERHPRNCCANPLPNGCDVYWYLDAPLARVGHFNQIMGITGAPLSGSSWAWARRG